MKTYNFFAYLGRMKYIKRWSLMRSTVDETVMEHSEQVAQIAHALALINNRIFNGTVNPDRVVTLAVFHEAAEVITGDLPTPIKYFNNDIKTAYKSLERTATTKLLTMLPAVLREDYNAIIDPNIESFEYRLVKAADKICAFIKCTEELKCGNGEFKKAYNANKADVFACTLPEVQYFLENCYHGFELTLDELD